MPTSAANEDDAGVRERTPREPRRAMRNLAAFARLAAEPIPRLSALVNAVLVVLGIGGVGFLAWLRAPTVRHVRVGHHLIGVSVSSDRLAWGIAVAAVVVVLLLLRAGTSLRGEVASRPRLVFAGTDRDYATVTHGPLAVSTLYAGASGTGPPFSALGPLPIAGASSGLAVPTGSATVGASGPPGSTGRKPQGSGALGPSGPTSAQNEYVRVLVKNEPASGFGAAAEDVHASVEFLDGDDRRLLQMAGRWAEAPQRLETGRIGISYEAAQLTIPGNGFPHALDIAMRAPGDKHFYAVNDDNQSATNHRLDRHRLDVSECRLRVELRASNTPSVVGMFDLRDDGGRLTLTEHADSPVTRRAPTPVPDSEPKSTARGS